MRRQVSLPSLDTRKGSPSACKAPNVVSNGGSRIQCGSGSGCPRSHRLPRQFEILPSVAQRGQDQTTAPSRATSSSTAVFRHMKHPGATISRPGCVAAATTAPTNSANRRAGPFSGAMAPLSFRQCVTSMMYMASRGVNRGSRRQDRQERRRKHLVGQRRGSRCVAERSHYETVRLAYGLYRSKLRPAIASWDVASR